MSKKEETISALISIFGFSFDLAEKAINSIEDKEDIQLAYNWILDHGGEDKGGPVIPTLICPHIIQENLISPLQLEYSMKNSCSEGCLSDENWLCLTCGGSRCARYAQSHNLKHWQQTGHNIALSLCDLSIWCYSCDKYVRNILLQDISNYAQYYLKIEEEKLQNKNQIPPPPPEFLNNINYKFSYISYDTFTEKHYHPNKNASTIHQLENPDRTKSIIKHLTNNSLLYNFITLPSKLPTKEELLQVHSLEYINFLESSATDEFDETLINQFSSSDIYLNRSSYEAALRSAGSTLAICHEILTGKAKNGFAITRPPGHHAKRSSTSGFCLLNNVALAVNYLLQSSSNTNLLNQNEEKIERILVFDWDVHHGDGIQDIFYDDNRVLYISIHRHEHSPGLYFDSNGDMYHCGIEKGLGYNVNIPLSYREQSYGDLEYTYFLQEIVIPISKQYNPQIILIAAGFDSCIHDPIGGNKLTPEWFGFATDVFQSSVVSSCHQGKVILSLEGGYNSTQTSFCTESCLKSLLSFQLNQSETEIEKLSHNLVSNDIQTLVNQIQTIQSRYWKFDNLNN